MKLNALEREWFALGDCFPPKIETEIRMYLLELAEVPDAVRDFEASLRELAWIRGEFDKTLSQMNNLLQHPNLLPAGKNGKPDLKTAGAERTIAYQMRMQVDLRYKNIEALRKQAQAALKNLLDAAQAFAGDPAKPTFDKLKNAGAVWAAVCSKGAWFKGDPKEIVKLAEDVLSAAQEMSGTKTFVENTRLAIEKQTGQMKPLVNDIRDGLNKLSSLRI